MTASVERVLGRLGVTTMRIGTRWWVETCPMPGHRAPNPAHRFKNFFVRDDTARAHAREFHCYSCQAGGKLVELVMVVRACSFREALDWLEEIDDGGGVAPFLRVRVEPYRVGVSIRLPEGVESPPWSEWLTPPRRYCESRGVTADQAERWRFGYALVGRMRGRIVIPIHGVNDRLANYQGRTFVDDDVRYLSAPEVEGPDEAVYWGEHLWPTRTERGVLIVCEGAFNGLAIERVLVDAGWAGVHLGGLQGSHFDHRKAAKLDGWRRIIVASDPDPAGDAVYAAVDAARRHSGCEVSRLRYPTACDAADTPPELLGHTIHRALTMPPSEDRTAGS